MAYRRKPRRGVLLLVVLSLLVLFVLVGITFVVVAGQYRRTTISAIRHERTGDPPEKLLTQAVMQLIRDTGNLESRVRDHSLLNDLYGGFTYYNYLNDTNPLNDQLVCQAEAIEFLEPTSSPDYYASPPQEDDFLFFRASPPLSGLSWSVLEDDYSGRVITFLDGPLAGHSTRVVKYWPNGPTWNPSQPTFAVEKPEREGELPSAQQLNIAAGNGGFAFIINGRPFDGLGAGVNPNDRSHISVGSNIPLALLPFRPSGFSTGYHAGGLDESWDAPDPENMFLACMASDPSSPGVVLPLIPSFHRPALLNYWRAQQGGSIADSALLSQIMLRPNWLDNPAFTGSNPALDIQTASHDELVNRVIQGYWDQNSNGIKDPNDPFAWDVDNDGDGVQDSVWIDLGMPVQHASDGRRYKPLFAFLIQDLDGRININAAGNIAQLNYDPVTRLPITDVDLATGNPFVYFDPAAGFRPADVTTSIAAGMTGAQQLRLPRGRGYSPADIDFIDSVGGDFSLYGQILFGRYGANGTPGWPGSDDGSNPWPDYTLSFAKQPELLDVYPHSVPGEAPVTTAFNSRSDTYGRDAVYLDRFGNTRYAIQDSNDTNRLILQGEAIDDPLEINLVTENFYDQPFAANELEPILRWFDAGAASTTSRLQPILGNPLLADSSTRELFTTRSFDVAALSLTTVLQDFADALQAGGAASPGDEIKKILPWEFFRGQKFDLNRLFANGVDDNSNGVADEPLELETGADNTAFSGTQVAGSAIYGNGIPSVGNAQGRQLFARHLYCLMVYITANYPGFPFNNGLETVPPVLRSEMKFRRLAQWAINVVDFRDADAVMTAFEYDINPLNGWDVDGIVDTDEGGDRRLVWGCESPELILTEALAFHDRRVRDTSSGTGFRADDPPDPTLDQYQIPEGSLFLELLCTGQPHTSNPTPPRDLYRGGYDELSSPVNLLDLERLTPPNANNDRFPVWRVAISEPHREGADSPLKTSFENPDTATFNPVDLTLQPGVQDLQLDRYIWFAHHAPPASLGPDAKRVFYNRADMPATIPAGTVAVVGPRPITMIGSQPDPGDANKTLPALQRITLNHTAGVVTHKIDNLTAETERRAVVIMAGADPPSSWSNLNRPVGVNISEPLPDTDYYEEPDLQLASYPTTDAYNTPPDTPFDGNGIAPLTDDEDMRRTGIYRNYRTAFLQRLADPTKPHDPTNPETNPYITVDWIPLDLNVFNGTEESGQTFIDNMNQEQPLDPDDPDAFNEDPPEQFSTRFRADVEYWVPVPDVENAETPQPNLSPTNNIWAPETMPPVASTANPNGVGDYFNHVLNQTLGILPDNYALVPWIAWNNRPYNSAYELTLVPASGPERLLYEFSMSPATGLDPYTDYNNPAIQRVEALPFGHLLNFFHDNVNPASTPGLYRLFDFVEVPSRFVGTERWFAQSLPLFQSPFNSLSRFREPGKINLNTIFDRRVWNAIAKNYPQQYATDITNTNDFFNKLWRSRQGNGAGIFQMDADFPTLFANPFRAASTSALMPPLASGAQWETGVQATVFRHDPDNATRGLFTPDPTMTVDGQVVYGPYNDPTRNAYFKYDGVQRLGNLVTTHSNVFAVWITVGFFEVTDANGDGTPDLGQELGSGTGQVKRHRGFYMIDRSIPVAFEPGLDHNVDKCIILRRFIE